MNLSDKIRTIWNRKYHDAIACGYGEEFATNYANRETATLRAELGRIERAQQPKTPRHTNLAGRRQYLLRNAGL